MAGLYLHQVLPTSERIGCFNSGLVTWHADIAAGSGFDPGRGRRGVVNLDGVVNVPAMSFAGTFFLAILRHPAVTIGLWH